MKRSSFELLVEFCANRYRSFRADDWLAILLMRDKIDGSLRFCGNVNHPVKYILSECAMNNVVQNVVDFNMSNMQSGMLIKSAYLKEVERESTMRMHFAKDVVAPLLAQAFNTKKVWVFGSVAEGQANVNSDLDILVEGGEGLSASKRLSIAYDVIASLDVPCGCDVVVLTEQEINAKRGVSFIESMMSQRVLMS